MISLIKDYVVPLSAIYGALLSTYNACQAFRKERRKIKVKALEYKGSVELSSYATIEATNIGQRSVTVKAIRFELPTGQLIEVPSPEDFCTPVGTQLPATLSDGESAHAYVPYLHIALGLDKNQKHNLELIPICEDSGGGIHRGEGWQVEVNKWYQ
jgi:hypothetical protein